MSFLPKLKVVMKTKFTCVFIFLSIFFSIANAAVNTNGIDATGVYHSLNTRPFSVSKQQKELDILVNKIIADAGNHIFKFKEISKELLNEDKKTSIQNILNADGTVNLNAGFNGSVDVKGYSIQYGKGKVPRFVKNSASPFVNDDDRWDNRFGGGNGVDVAVFAMAVSGSNVYVGGFFSTAGSVTANNIAKWNGSSWSNLGDGITDTTGFGSVTAIAVSGTDVYVGGTFSTAGSSYVGNIAKWNGSAWSALGTGIADSSGLATVNAIAIKGTDVYVGGTFSTAGGNYVGNIAKWNGTVWSDLDTGFADVSSSVAALAFIGNDLYVGGNFLTVGSSSLIVNNIAKWNGTAWSALGTGADYRVTALAVSGTDVYIAGYFATTGGVTTNGIAKWNGTAWFALGDGLDISFATIASLAIKGGNVYVGGFFNSINGGVVTASNIAMWDGTAWSALNNGTDGDIYSLAASATGVYAAGYFTQTDVNSNSIALWNGSSWSALGLSLSIDAPIAAMVVKDNKLYVGGYFTTMGGIVTNGIAVWDGKKWAALGDGLNGYAYALTVKGNDIYVGGDFSFAGSVSANGIAKWDGTSWSALGTGMGGVTPCGCSTAVYALAVNNNKIYAAGSFSEAGGVTANNIAFWDGTVWSALGNGTDDYINSIAINNNKVYAAGAFLNAGGTAANYIAVWDGSSWSALGNGTDDEVASIVFNGNDLYAGGYFINAGAVTANGIAKWDGVSWSALGSGSGSDNIVTCLAVINNNLYVGGMFQTIDGMLALGIAKWDGASWSALGTGLTNFFLSPSVPFVINNIGSNIYVGGDFSLAGGKPSPYFASYNTGFLWEGLTSNDWDDATNWYNSLKPTTSTDDVLIPATGVYNEPVVSSANVSINDLMIAGSRTLTVNTVNANHIFSLAGNIISDGTFVADSAIIQFNGNIAQNIPDSIFQNNTINSLTINNTTGVTLNGMLNVTGVLTVTAGTFSIQNNLTLKSRSADSTGKIAALPDTASITGTVTIEQFIPAKRGYRTIAHPFSTSVSLSSFASNSNIDLNNGTASSPTAFFYNSSVPQASSPWTAAGASAWNANKGMLLFIRGKRGEGVGGGSYTPSNVTLAATGTINRGTQDYSLTYNATNTNTQWNLITNPYPCPVSLNAVTLVGGTTIYADNNVHVSKDIYYWNPNKTSVNGKDGIDGGYDFITLSAGTDLVIPSMSSFFIKTLTAGNILRMTENSKKITSAPVNTIFDVPSNQTEKAVTLSLQQNDKEWDKLVLRFVKGAASTAKDNFDLNKFSNQNLDFYTISSDSSKLAIDSRDINFDGIIPLGLRSVVQKTFTIKSSQYNPPTNIELYLKDNLLNTETLIKKDMVYSFDVTAAKETQGEQRFQVITKAVAIIVPVPVIATISISPNPVTDVLQITTGTINGTTHIKIINEVGQTIKSVITQSSSIKIPVQQLSNGIYFVEVKNDKQTVIEKIIKH
jgi:hypothetical protein